jgi:hypothetical protein
MSILNLLDPELGRKIRHALTIILTVLSVALLILQKAADVLESLPKWSWVSQVSLWIVTAVQMLTYWSSIGNKVVK